MNERDEAIRANHLLMIRWRTVANELAEALDGLVRDINGGVILMQADFNEARAALAKYREAVES